MIRILFRDLQIRLWGPEIKHPKAHNFVVQEYFFLPLLFRYFDDHMSVDKHQVRRLVFDNYQKCPVKI